MAGDETPDAPPPEVPEEFAAAYQEAYRRALGEPESGRSPAAEAGFAGDEQVTEYRTATVLDWVRERRWAAPLLAALGMLLLVLVVWLLAGALGGDEQVAPPASRAGTPQTSAPATGEPGGQEPVPEPTPRPYDGPVAARPVTDATATCTLEPGTDAAGRRVSYEAANAVDDDATTAWRCGGDARGERLVLRLPQRTELAEVGLVPGYAKTDPANGADRYAENNRITRVRWIVAPGVSFIQRLDPDPRERTLQSLRIPVTASARVVLEILEVQQGSRRVTAISEIRLSVPR